MLAGSSRPDSTGPARRGLGCCLALLALPLAGLLLLALNLVLPADLSPEAAHYDTEKWVGRQVRVKGVLRLFTGSTGPHYAVEDAQQNRVGVKNVPAATLQPLLDRPVVMEGKFNFDQQSGIYVEVTSLRAGG